MLKQEGKTVSQLIEEIGASPDIISLLRMFDIALQPVKSLVSYCETVETLTCSSADKIESKKGSKSNEQSMEQVGL